MPSSNRYKRIMIKISGEALAGSAKTGIDSSIVKKLADEIKTVSQAGFEIALVIGGGNIFRGGTGEALGVERTTGDHMGMLATVINALAMHSALSNSGVDSLYDKERKTQLSRKESCSDGGWYRESFFYH